MMITKKRVIERATRMGLNTHVNAPAPRCHLHYWFQSGTLDTPVATSTAEAYAMLDGIEFGRRLQSQIEANTLAFKENDR